MSAPYPGYSSLTLEEIRSAIELLQRTEPFPSNRISVTPVSEMHYRITSRGFLAIVRQEDWDKAVKEAILKNERASGRTTRQADAYIQELFTNGKIKVRDHSGVPVANLILFNRIVFRLKEEHDEREFKFNRKTFTITYTKQ